MTQLINHSYALSTLSFPVFSDVLYAKIVAQNINASVLIKNTNGNNEIIHIDTVNRLSWKMMQIISKIDGTHWENMIDIFNTFSFFCNYEPIYSVLPKTKRIDHDFIMIYIHDEDLFLCTTQNKYFINKNEFIDNSFLQELLNTVFPVKNRFILSLQHQVLLRSIVSQ